MGARMYSPGLGRFLGSDPLSTRPDQVAYTPYHYTFNDPVNHTDPTGEVPVPTIAIGAVVGTVIGGVGSYMRQTTSGDGQVDWGRVSLDAGKGALAGAAVGSGAGLIAGAAEMGVGAQLMTSGAVSAGATLVSETAGELVEMGTTELLRATSTAQGGTIDPSFDAEGVATSTVVGGVAGMLGPVVEEAAGPVVRGLSMSAPGAAAATEATEESLTASVVATVETVTNTISGYWNSWLSSDDGE